MKKALSFFLVVTLMIYSIGSAFAVPLHNAGNMELFSLADTPDYVIKSI